MHTAELATPVPKEIRTANFWPRVLAVLIAILSLSYAIPAIVRVQSIDTIAPSVIDHALEIGNAQFLVCAKAGPGCFGFASSSFSNEREQKLAMEGDFTLNEAKRRTTLHGKFEIGFSEYRILQSLRVAFTQDNGTKLSISAPKGTLPLASVRFTRLGTEEEFTIRVPQPLLLQERDGGARHHLSTPVVLRPFLEVGRAPFTLRGTTDNQLVSQQLQTPFETEEKFLDSLHEQLKVFREDRHDKNS